MTRRGCASLFGGSILLLIIPFLMLFGPQSCVELLLPDESFEDGDVDFFLSKLKSWRLRTRNRAVWKLKYKTDERNREKIIAALTHVLLNDSHEEIRVSAAQVLARQKPAAAEAVPALIKALNLPKRERGKLTHYYLMDTIPLPEAAADALKSIGTPEALAALDEFKKAGPKLIESSIADNESEVDAEFINENGITLRFRGNTNGVAGLVHPAVSRHTRMWKQSVKADSVTLKPRRNDPKLLNGTVYKVDVYLKDDFYRTFHTEIAFTTKP